MFSNLLVKTFIKDNENIEARIKETQERLDWLEKIQNKVNGILEI